jgi:hypothetical protein
MKLPEIIYTPGNKMLNFRCPKCDSFFGFKAGIEPKPRTIMQARCPGCLLVYPGEVRDWEVIRTKEER